jgi:hypothetical protein
MKPQASKRDRASHHKTRAMSKSAGYCSITGKVIYRNERIANQAVARMWAKQPDEEIGSIHSWQCEHCGKYHIGHDGWRL